MMNFLDLSASSEEERRLIKEILADTSVVNFAIEPKLQPINTNNNSNSNQNLTNNNSTTSTSTSPPLPPQSSFRNQQHQTSTPSSNNLIATNNTNSSTQIFNGTNNIINLATFNNSNRLGGNQNVNSSQHQRNKNNNYHHKNDNSSNYNNVTNVTTTTTTTSIGTSNINNYNHSRDDNLSGRNNNNNVYRLANTNSNHQTNSWNANQQSTTQGNLKTNINNTTQNPQHYSQDSKPTNQHQQHHNNHQPQPQHFHHQHQQQQNIHQSTSPNTVPTSTTTQASTSLTGSTQSVPTPQMPTLAGDMNSVISMDLNNSSQPQGYAIQPPPPHVAAAFGPPHVYGGTPIFHQPYHYITIPYNIPPAYVPYVLPNSVVQPRHQVAPSMSSQQPNASSSQPRSHQHHQSVHHQQQQHQQHHQHHPQHFKIDSMSHNLNGGPNNHRTIPGQLHQNHNHQLQKNGSNTAFRQIQHVDADRPEQSQNIQVKTSERDSNDSQTEILSVTKTSSSTRETVTAQPDNRTTVDMPENVSKLDDHPRANNSDKPNYEPNSNLNDNNDTANTKNLSHIDAYDDPIQVPDRNEAMSTQTKTNFTINKRAEQKSDSKLDEANAKSSKTPNEERVKVSSDEGFETQSSLDISKQSYESTQPIDDTVKMPSGSKSNESNEQSDSVSESGHKSVWGSASSKSWASLFKRGGDASGSIGKTDQNNASEVENSDEEGKTPRQIINDSQNGSKISSHQLSSKDERSQEAANRALYKMAPRLARKINSINLKHALPFLRLRGFINKGNGCYINATLQALIACPPFYNLMREIADLKGFHRDNSCTPILDGFAELFQNFPPLETKKNKQISNTQDQKINVNNLQAEPMEPKCIYNILGQIKSEYHKGAQEDAEEFLSSVLNSLHEEMIRLSEALQEVSARSGQPSDVEDSNDDLANDDNLWREVGPKNRSLPIRTAKVVNTPIQEIFGGSLFSIRTARKDSCGHRSPFFDLQLDISGDNVKSVNEAIMSFTAPETIHDFYCSKTKQKLDAQRRTSLDQLPPILILHLKQFVYNQDHGLKKLMKKIEYPIDFEIPEFCLHEKISNDKSKTSRSYKLLAVVYHDGKEAIKGHYLTDVYHIGSSQWLRCDDGTLKVIPSPRIENPDSSRTPYLLFYRRLNTLRGPTSNHENRKKV